MDVFSKLLQANANAGSPLSPQQDQLSQPQPNSANSFEERLANGASKASNALAASAGRDLSSAEAQGKGRLVDRSTSGLTAVYNVTESTPASPPQLQGTSITHIATEKPDKIRKTIAVNEDYIAYGLQKAHIRLLHRGNGYRALLKHHETPILDLRFSGLQSCNLASFDESNTLVLWQFACDEMEGVILAEKLAVHQFDFPQGSLAFMTWMTTGDKVGIAGGNELHMVRLPDQSTPQFQDRRALGHLGDSQVTQIAASSEWELFHAAADGMVQLVRLQQGYAQAIQSFSLEGTPSFLTTLTEGLILVGSSNNTVFTILRLGGYASDTLEAMTSVDELRLEGASVKEMAGLVSYAPFSRLLVIANFHGPHLIVASLSEDLNSFVSVTVFDVTMPVYSMDITESEAGDGTQDIQVFAVQSKEIRQLNLSAAQCQARSSASPPRPSTISIPGLPSVAQNSDLPDPSDALSPRLAEKRPGAHALNGEYPRPSDIVPSEQAPLSLPNKVIYSTPSGTNLNNPPAADDQPQTKRDNTNSPIEPAPTRPAYNSSNTDGQRSPAGLAFLQKLQRAPIPAVPAATSAGPPTERTMLNATQIALPRHHSGASSMFTEAEGPKATPRQPTGLHESQTGSQPTIKLAEDSATHADLNTLLDSEDAVPQEQNVASEREIDNSAVPSLSRDSMSSTTAVANYDVGRTTHSAPTSAQDNSLDKRQKPPRATPKSSANEIANSSTPGTQAQNGGKESSYVIIDRLLKSTLKQVKQEIQGLRDTQQRAMRDMADTMQKQFEKNLEAASALQEIRMSELLDRQTQDHNETAEMHSSFARDQMIKFMKIISADLNEHVPNRVAKAMAPRLEDLVGATQAAVQSAVTSSLPKDLQGTNLQMSLESALNSQLPAALSQPLHQNFVQSFKRDVMPAFETATQSMFAQVQATFAGGLQDHLQAARGVEANAASQLQDALQDARHVTAVLQQNVATDVKTLSEYAISSAAQQHCDATQQEQAQQSEPNVQQIEATVAEAQKFLALNKYAEAFTVILNFGHIATLAWLCSVVSSSTVLQNNLLSQTTLLVLLNQLGHEILLDTRTKLVWIKEIAEELEPNDPELAQHRQQLESVLSTTLQILQSTPLEGQNAKIAGNAMAVLQHVLRQVQTGPYL